MHETIKVLLDKYECSTVHDCENALKEIIQEIALLGLWRAKFFEHAAFYGGSALRILYGLNRFSEDLNFTLLKTDKTFKLDKYNEAVADELTSFGFKVTVEGKLKNIASTIESAFIKTGTKQQMLLIEAPPHLTVVLHQMRVLKIKMEVDIDPPGKLTVENKTLLQPIPFSVKTLEKSDLFAGKMHALLCRKWKTRVKGRDWYDLYWYVANAVPLNLTHLRERLIQSAAWEEAKVLKADAVKELLKNKISRIDFQQARQDVLPFI